MTASSREAVLASVRRALAGAPNRPPAPRGYRASTSTAGVDVAMFVQRVEDYRATVVRCSPDRVEATIAGALDGRTAVVPPGLPWTVSGALVDGNPPLGAADLDQVEAVVTAARLGIALTGTVVLDHTHDQGRRAISLLPDVHVCVLGVDQLVPGVAEAVALLDPRRPHTWISGPSATSDIELERVEGVHGPRSLTVVLVHST